MPDGERRQLILDREERRLLTKNQVGGLGGGGLAGPSRICRASDSRSCVLPVDRVLDIPELDGCRSCVLLCVGVWRVRPSAARKLKRESGLKGAGEPTWVRE